MAIVSFWNESKKETSQTLSLVAIATYMSIEHNYKTLIIDANRNDNTLYKCFWKESRIASELRKELNSGKVDIVAGTEGLLSAISSNKTTPEIISTYTKIVFKSRLDVLLGLRNLSNEEYKKNLKLYPELIRAANKYYDLVIIDLPKGLENESVREILGLSDVIIYTMEQNLTQISEYIKDKETIKSNYAKCIIPVLTNIDFQCKYNLKNVTTYIKDKNLGGIYHNNVFLEAANEGNVASFFTGARLSRKNFDTNYSFLMSIDEIAKNIISKFEEIKYGNIH